MRIGLGLIFFSFYLGLAPDFINIFSPKNLGIHEWGWLPNEDWCYWLLYVGVLISAFTTALGLMTTTSLIALLVFHTLLYQSNISAYWGWGSTSRIFLALLILSGNSNRMWSLDLKCNRVIEVTTTYAWKIRIFQWQLALIYFLTCFNRFSSIEWWDGSFATFLLSDTSYTRFTSIDLLPWAPWLKLPSFASLLLEHLGAVLPFLGPLQGFAAVGLVGMHVATESLVLIQQWQLLMILALFFYLPKNWWKAKPEVLAPLTTGKQKRIVALIVTGSAVLLLDALTPPQMRTFVNPIAQIVKASTFTSNRYMQMVAQVSRIGRFCLFGIQESPLGTLVAYSPRFCSQPVRFLDDPVFSTQYRMLIASGSRRQRAQVGRFHCARLSTLGDSKIHMIVGFENVVKNESGELTRSPMAFRPLVSFDCSSHHLVPVQSQQFVDEVIRNHGDQLRFSAHDGEKP